MKDWQGEAFRYALKRWGQLQDHQPCIRTSGGACQIGVIAGETFYCFGQGKDWRTAINDAEDHKNYQSTHSVSG